MSQKKLGGKNAEYEEEKRLEKEKQEKAIGLLTYLGQGSIELEGMSLPIFHFIQNLTKTAGHDFIFIWQTDYMCIGIAVLSTEHEVLFMLFWTSVAVFIVV